MDWEQKLNEQPHNWNFRFQYASFLEAADMMDECAAQRWMAENEKYPGPPCVLESHELEATWFSSENKEGSKWSFPPFVKHNKIDRCWVLPVDIFTRLEGFITVRRDGGFHNKWAKSWNSRVEAEAAFVVALLGRKRKYRSIDDRWKPSGC